MAIKLTDENELEKIAGSAISSKSHDKYFFMCTKCVYFWTGNDSDPTKVHGSKRYGWWFQTLEDNGNWKKECIVYVPLVALRNIKKYKEKREHKQLQFFGKFQTFLIIILY